MMKSCYGLGLYTFGMVGIVAPVMADTMASGKSDGAVSCALALDLYTSVGNLLSGNLGLILGLILVFMGLWSMIQGGKATAAVPIIIVGALITALPSLIMSNLQGLATLLKDVGISEVSPDSFDTKTIKQTKCPEPPADEERKARYGSKTEFYNGRSTYEVEQAIKLMTGDIPYPTEGPKF